MNLDFHISEVGLLNDHTQFGVGRCQNNMHGYILITILSKRQRSDESLVQVTRGFCANRVWYQSLSAITIT